MRRGMRTEIMIRMRRWVKRRMREGSDEGEADDEEGMKRRMRSNMSKGMRRRTKPIKPTMQPPD